MGVIESENIHLSVSPVAMYVQAVLYVLVDRTRQPNWEQLQSTSTYVCTYEYMHLQFVEGM